MPNTPIMPKTSKLQNFKKSQFGNMQCASGCKVTEKSQQSKNLGYLCNMLDNEELARLLRSMADRYETREFINGDPSWFMHQVAGRENQETIAFVASVLSYGRREQFMPRIGRILDHSEGKPYQWVVEGRYRSLIPDDGKCFYRLYDNHMMLSLLDVLKGMLSDYGSIGSFVSFTTPHHDAVEALEALSAYFRERGIKSMVPSPRTSAAKRPCMFLRWMVRSGSPVDLGLWSDMIDRRTLLIPLDTHVLSEARNLGLISGKSASWSAVVRLTEAMRKVFPDDPARGDFALFGVGINRS